MNIINIETLSDFDYINNSEVLITQNKTLQQEEITRNLWAITLSDSLYDQVTTGDIVKYIEKIIENRQSQINDHAIASPITFYVWFDEMALQLRLNIISGCGEQLPFDCQTTSATLEEIVHRFLATKSWPDPVEDLTETVGHEYILPVFQTCLT